MRVIALQDLALEGRKKVAARFAWWSETQPQVDMTERTKAPAGRHSIHCVAPLGLQAFVPRILGFRPPKANFTPGYCLSSLRDFGGRNSFSKMRMV